ncbi:MAG: DUF4830 domain-containing protein [Oscillospiraceae bacterium]|nr:DUF4830 domain-containing protein [Oscillospiraceae bacterium]MCD8256025.1 DUF4830 domain-containing protein [Oscillospiraceae bacterium]
MFITLKFDRKKAVMGVVLAALVVIGVILLVSAHSRAAGDAGREPVSTVRTEKARAAYLSQYGWEVETPALREEQVVIPRTFSDVFEEYNALQQRQGFDLSRYCGMEVTMYTYRVSNAGTDGEVLAVLYVLNGHVIGGDVHSTALDGFMTGVRDGADSL